MISVVEEHAERLGVEAVCDAIGLSRATFYRRDRSKQPAPAGPRAPSPRALSDDERADVLALLHQPDYVDLAPAQIVAKLLDESRYLCSERTMYRLLEANKECRERRDQLRHPIYSAPELLATAPNQVWSWDITKLLGPTKGCYYHLYVVLDIFSRYTVGWMLSPKESGVLAEKLLGECCERQRISRNQLTLHADRGTSMKSKPLAMLLADLGVAKSHSRPQVSNDNPFSESQFKTLKYRPTFPEYFDNIEAARAFCRTFFDWYNLEHRHSGIGYYTPRDVHCGVARERADVRAAALRTAFLAKPERFPLGMPHPQPIPTEVWINRPKPSSAQ